MIRTILENLSSQEVRGLWGYLQTNAPALSQLVDEPLSSEIEGKETPKIEPPKTEKTHANEGDGEKKEHEHTPFGPEKYGPMFVALSGAMVGASLPLIHSQLTSQKSDLHALGVLNNFLKSSSSRIDVALGQEPQDLKYLFRKIKIFQEVSLLAEKMEEDLEVPKPEVDLSARKRYEKKQLEWLIEGHEVDQVLGVEEDLVERDSLASKHVREVYEKTKRKAKTSKFMAEEGTDLSIKSALD